MNSRDYWRLRYLQLKASSERAGTLYEQASLDQLDAINTTLNQQIINWYKRYARTADTDFDTAARLLKSAHKGDWRMTLDEFTRKAKAGGYDKELDLEYIQQQVARLEQLQGQLARTVAPVTPQVAMGFEEALKANYVNTYSHTKYLNESATGFASNFAQFDDKLLMMVVSKPWAGGNFSHRIWKNLNQYLPNILVRNLSEAVVLGYSSKKVAKRLSEQFKDFQYKYWHRLVQSEMAHVAEQATLQTYEEDGIDEYEYLATLETRTCDDCRHFDHHYFKMSDRVDSINYPPIHSFCRCTTVPRIKGMPSAGKRWSRNPATGKREMVDDISFEEWQRGNGSKSTSKPVKTAANSSLTGKIGQTNLGKVLSTHEVEQFTRVVDGAPKVLRDQYASQIQNLNFVENTGEAYRDYHGIHISSADVAGSADYKPLQVVFHEIGHALDAKPSKIGALKPSATVGLREAIDQDFWNYFADGKSYTGDDLKAIKKIRPRKNSKDYETKYAAYQKAQNDFYAGYDKYRAKLNQKIDEWKKLDKSTTADLSDMLEATGHTAESPIGYGHGKSYWSDTEVNVISGKKVVKNYNRESEFFAEASSELATNPAALELGKSVFPSAYKLYDEISKKIVKRDDLSRDELEKEKIKKESQYVANLDYMRSKEFVNKINNDDQLRPYAKAVTQISQQMLRHRNGTPYEDIALISRSTRQVETLYDGSKAPHAIDHYTNAMKTVFNSGKRNGYIIVHNHPASVPPSPNDIMSLQKKHNGTVLYGVIAGHNGTMYTYTRPTKRLPNSFARYYENVYSHVKIGSEAEKQLITLERLGEIYGFKVKKI